MEQNKNLIRSPDPDEGEPAGESTDLAGFDPVDVEARHDGWTPERQRAFIEALADCGIVREAAARVGMTEQSVRRLRRRPGAKGFSRAWEEAIEIGTSRLHSIAYDRAINGRVKRHYYKGEVIGEEIIHDNRLLTYLLGKKGDHSHLSQHWSRSIDALFDGRRYPYPPPGQYNSPVWRTLYEANNADGSVTKSEVWVTSLAPPAGFDGEQVGEYGEESYFRALTDEELAAMEAWEARREAQEERQRQGFFAGLD